MCQKTAHEIHLKSHHHAIDIIIIVISACMRNFACKLRGHNFVCVNSVYPFSSNINIVKGPIELSCIVNKLVVINICTKTFRYRNGTVRTTAINNNNSRY